MGGASLGEVLAGAEAISEPFRVVVVVRAASPLDPAALVGSSAQLGMSVGGVGTSVAGLVTEARVSASPQGQGQGLIVLTLEPALARLARGSGFSIHQQISAPDIVQGFLVDAGVPAEFHLAETHPVLDFQVRYG